MGNAVEQAYRRGDALEKRRALMVDWARYCSGGASAKVIKLTVKRGRRDAFDKALAPATFESKQCL